MQDWTDTCEQTKIAVLTTEYGQGKAMAQKYNWMGTEQWNASETNSQKKRKEKKNVQDRRQAMLANHLYETGNDKQHLFCTQVFKSSTGKEMSAGDFYH